MAELQAIVVWLCKNYNYPERHLLDIVETYCEEHKITTLDGFLKENHTKGTKVRCNFTVLLVCLTKLV